MFGGTFPASDSPNLIKVESRGQQPFLTHFSSGLDQLASTIGWNEVRLEMDDTRVAQTRQLTGLLISAKVPMLSP
jgi:hypothetical protein